METGDCDVTAYTVTHVMNMQYVLCNVGIELSDITKKNIGFEALNWTKPCVRIQKSCTHALQGT